MLVRSLAVLALIPVATLAAQRDSYPEGADACRAIWHEYGRSMHNDPEAVYCEVREVGNYRPASTIEVDGSERTGVRVRGAARADAHVRLVIQAQGRSVEDAKQLASGVRLDLSQSPLRVEGVTRNPRGDESRFVSATIVLDAPEKSNLSLRVSYAGLEVEGVTGRMDLRAEYGPLTVRDAGGDVRARVEYGPLTVELSGPRWQGAGLDAEAQYGPVTLRVPRDFNANLEIAARHGPMDVDFPLTLSRLDGSTIETTLGSGGPRVRAVADYGPMSLQISR